MSIQFAQSDVASFLRWEKRSQDTIDVKRCYVDIAGDLVTGVLLSQIIYWYLPGTRGASKLKVEHEGYWWIAKKREDWWDEARVSPKQFDRSIGVLEDKGFVETKLLRFYGSNIKHVRLKWKELFQALDALPDIDIPQKSIPILPPEVEHECTEEKAYSPKVNDQFTQRSMTNLPKGEITSIYTETTPEITPETTLPPAPQRGKEGERNFGFEIRQESLPQSVVTLSQSEATQEMTDTLVVVTVPPQVPTDKFFTGKTRDQLKYDKWAETAHPALVYGAEDTPWLEKPTRAEFVRFNQSFLDWHTDRAMQKFHKQDRFQAEGDFKGSLHNNPERCASRWAEYHKHMVCHAATAAARMNNGIEISDSEKQKFVKHKRAFTKITSESIESIDPKIVEAARPISATPQIESVATVTDDLWDEIASDMSDMEAQAINETLQNVPEGAENYEAYKQIVKPEDRDYWAKISQQGNKPSIRSTPAISAQQVKEQVEQINKARLATSAQIKAKKLERSRIEFWNNQLRSGNEGAIALTHLQVKKAGYIIVNGQVEDVEF